MATGLVPRPGNEIPLEDRGNRPGARVSWPLLETSAARSTRPPEASSPRPTLSFSGSVAEPGNWLVPLTCQARQRRFRGNSPWTPGSPAAEQVLMLFEARYCFVRLSESSAIFWPTAQNTFPILPQNGQRRPFSAFSVSRRRGKTG